MIHKSEQHLISPSESHVKIRRIKEIITCCTNSPYQHLKECIENSMENMHTDLRVERVKRVITQSNREFIS